MGATDSEYEENVAQMSFATMLSAPSHEPAMSEAYESDHTHGAPDTACAAGT